MPRPLSLLLALLSIGCAHMRLAHTRLTHAQAEAEFLGRYAGRMSQACGERFELARSRSGIIITTNPGIQETMATLTTCKQALTFKLDCRMPNKAHGWACHDHFLPTPEGLGKPYDQSSELALVLGALEAGGCGDDRKAPYTGSLTLARTERGHVSSNPTVLRSTWTGDVCGKHWAVETSCVYEGIRRIGTCSVGPLTAL